MPAYLSNYLIFVGAAIAETVRVLRILDLGVARPDNPLACPRPAGISNRSPTC